MAESSSPAFNPPVNTVKDSDPLIVRVPQDRVDFGFRKSQQMPMHNEHMAVVHVSGNGK